MPRFGLFAAAKADVQNELVGEQMNSHDQRPRLDVPGDMTAVITEDVLYGSAPTSSNVTVSYNGRPWAQVRADGRSGLNYSCQLPAVDASDTADIAVSDTETGRIIERLHQVQRRPLTNSFGLKASEVLSVHAAPLSDPFNLVLDGTTLTIYGSHLPPGGDPSRLSVRCNPGVRFKFEPGLYSHGFGDHYWYWPNANLSSFRLSIDLSGSDNDADASSFSFVYLSDDRPPKLGPTIYIPQNLLSFIGYPSLAQITRVQTYDNIHSAAFSGYHAYRILADVMTTHDISSGARILDFGCGYGRIARHFIQNWSRSAICGIDVDAQNVSWCQDHIGGGDFRLGPLWPETSFEGSSFDALFSISVMTHFTAAAQEAWLKEFHRLLKPGGLALLSFNGAAAVAYTSRTRTPTWWRRWTEAGFDDSEHDLTLRGQLGDHTYYRNTYQNNMDIKTRWTNKFTLEHIIDDFLGYQSLAILKAK